ncbi:MAG: right-handed parallel beta-helix repeat-containing protein [Planctomycetes bacterium]|nr:right-handed parallel beta-helix repeat-containing protein [Planctomycetota bacterium]MBL7043519.1 right-handed parallel beta-helix repeat-containing protein [Pirellulaceae bacterium]
MSRYVIFAVIASTIVWGAISAWCGEPAPMADDQPDDPHVFVNVRNFAHLVNDDDWSLAIQAAIDHVCKDNGFDAGGTVLLPAGTYRIDRPIVVGNKPAHWGLRLSGYGATMVGTPELDKQPLPDPEPEAKDKGVPMLVLKAPEGIEGAGYCIEGLRLTREREPGSSVTGVGISVPYKEVPKGTTIRNVKVHGQKVGVHVKFAWQIYFTDCIFRGNETGMIIQCHGNNIGITNCIFRRNHHHGLVIGPDRGQTASNAQHILNSIFEANKGYGILLLTSGQTMITGNYFEANGNDIGAMSAWQTTIDTNFFWGSYGHGWEVNPYSDSANIVVGKARSLQLRNNQYSQVTAWFCRKEGTKRWEYAPRARGPHGVSEHKPRLPEKQPGYEYRELPCPILVVGTVWDDGNVFDALPLVHHKAAIRQPRVVRDSGLQYYEYDADTNEFVVKSLLPKLGKEETPEPR